MDIVWFYWRRGTLRLQLQHEHFTFRMHKTTNLNSMLDQWLTLFFPFTQCILINFKRFGRIMQSVPMGFGHMIIHSPLICSFTTDSFLTADHFNNSSENWRLKPLLIYQNTRNFSGKSSSSIFISINTAGVANTGKSKGYNWTHGMVWTHKCQDTRTNVQSLCLHASSMLKCVVVVVTDSIVLQWIVDQAGCLFNWTNTSIKRNLEYIRWGLPE